MNTKLTTAESWSLLRESAVGRLGVVVDGQPDIFPVNHVVDHGSVVFRTAEGTKLAASIGQRVAFEVDGYDLTTASAWSVVIKGRAQEVWEQDDILDAVRLPIYPWDSAPKPRYVRLAPDSVTGRRFVVPGGVRTDA